MIPVYLDCPVCGQRSVLVKVSRDGETTDPVCQWGCDVSGLDVHEDAVQEAPVAWDMMRSADTQAGW